MRSDQAQRPIFSGRSTSPTAGKGLALAGAVVRFAGGEIQRNRRLKLKLDDSLLPDWADGDTLELLFPQVSRDHLEGEPLAYFVEGATSWPAIVWREREIVCGFPPEETIDYLRLERYMPSPSGVQKLLGRLPHHYQYIPPYWRVWILQQLVHWRRRASSPDSFPRWPGDDTADLLRHVLQRCQSPTSGSTGGDSLPWSLGKKYAVAFTHDVDTPWCLETRNELAEIEDKHDVRSAWYVVGEHMRRPEAAAAISRLVEKGHEVGCHGWRHEPGLAGFPSPKLNDIVRRCVEAMGRYGEVRGFRAPFLSRGPALYAALATAFAYDASCPDSERYVTSTSSGCCTLYPYFIGNLLELPLSVPQDAVLLAMGYGSDEIHRIWKEKVNWIKERGGLAIVSTHPEPQFGATPSVLTAYDRLLDWISRDDEAWLARPGQIAEWWLSRRRP